MAETKKENWFKRTWGKIKKYFRELKSELGKVVWPTPKQVAKNTLIVLACVAIVGAFIWVFDYVATIGIDGLVNWLRSLVH
ncbi:MAG: preprotein translocase subunit SecE [Oscillospiraceae bacterium]|nr:preprotein translocase subunit SecE [Oscillospiraceae bacterium]